MRTKWWATLVALMMVTALLVAACDSPSATPPPPVATSTPPAPPEPTSVATPPTIIGGYWIGCRPVNLIVPDDWDGTGECTVDGGAQFLIWTGPGSRAPELPKLLFEPKDDRWQSFLGVTQDGKTYLIEVDEVWPSGRSQIWYWSSP